MNTHLFPSLLLIGCTGSSFSQGEIPTGGDDTGVESTDSGTDDTGELVDDTGDPVEEICTNLWHPVHLSGWSKTFTATYEGSSGTATEEGLGALAGEEGEYLYQYRDAISNADGAGYDVTVTVSCGLGTEEGMFMHGWSGVYTYSLFGFPIDNEVIATHDNPRRYLSPEWSLGAEGSWDYDYTLRIEQPAKQGGGGGGGGQPTVTEQAVSGTYTDAGMVEISLFDGSTVTAYKLTNNALIVTDNGFGTSEQDIYIEQYWVKGLGLVEEVFEDQTEGTVLLTKELSAYSGLTPK